jgi:hypothetical protein
MNGRRPSHGLSRRERNPRSISDSQQILPLAKVTLEANAFGDLEAVDSAAAWA